MNLRTLEEIKRYFSLIRDAQFNCTYFVYKEYTFFCKNVWFLLNVDVRIFPKKYTYFRNIRILFHI